MYFPSPSASVFCFASATLFLIILKVGTITSYQDFYKLLTSHGYLPQILGPSGITDNSAIIIDNIYTKISEHNSMSSTILLSI